MNAGQFDSHTESQIAQLAAQFGDYTGVLGPPVPMQRSQSVAYTPQPVPQPDMSALHAEAKTILEKYQQQMQAELDKARDSRKTLTAAAQQILDAAKKNNLGIINKDEEENGSQQAGSTGEEAS